MGWRVISIEYYNSMSDAGKTLWLERNAKSSKDRKRLVLGVGYNDAPYKSQAYIDGVSVICPAYLCWSNLLKRRYSEPWLSAGKAYRGVTISDEWLSFSSFRDWWLVNQVDGWQIDKDILSNKNHYGKDECIFVPRWLNNFIEQREAGRGEFMIGVTYIKDRCRFQSRCRNPHTLKSETIGYFKNEIDAHLAWRERKLAHAKSLKCEMDAIDLRIYGRVVSIIESAR